MTKGHPGVWVVVRAYNEAPVIAQTLTGLQEAFDHIVVVDDGSTDATRAEAEATGVEVVSHLINLGAGAALQTGIWYALMREADIVVCFDADGQHQVSDLTGMIRRLREEEFQVLVGSRFLGGTVGIRRSRWMLLKAAVAFSNFVHRTRLTDAHNGLRVMTSEAAACLDVTQPGMAYASEIIHQFIRAGMRLGEHPVTVHYTDYSVSKGQRSLNAVNVVLDLVLGRFSA